MTTAPVRTQSLESVTGVQLAQGVGVQPAMGFWADAWSNVLKRRGAVMALSWLSLVATLAVLAPFIASGHPLLMFSAGPDGTFGKPSSPLLSHLRSSEIVLGVCTLIGLIYIFAPGRRGRAARLGACIVGGLQAALVVTLSSIVQSWTMQRDPTGLAAWLKGQPSVGALVPGVLGAVVFTLGFLVPAITDLGRRSAVGFLACSIAAGAVWLSWNRPLDVFDYPQRERSGEVRAVYTLIPWSPSQRFTELDRQPPGSTFGKALGLPAQSPGENRTFWFGTDAFGQDVLAQLIHASRLSISIGLVSTGIAVLIGVTMGALMGYFGGLVDLVLFRVVEVFMAVPLLFLLIVAAGVLPPEMRTTYTMMAIIGCFTWTGAARFTRAEFMKLRNQDFVQAAKAVGVPVRSVLFKHMLPNGVTPVLVDASFAVAAAISIEATLSFLGLGPVDQASWGKLLASAVSAEGVFKWWLAVFPGAAIFLTVLSYNMLGESLRDAIDPKLKKARV